MRRIALLLVGGALALVGCGGDDVALDPVAEAATKTSELPSYRASLEVTMTVEGETVRMRGTGAFDNERRLGQMKMRMEGAQQVLPGGMEMVMQGSVFYLRMPALQQLVPDLKPWIEFDLEELGDGMGVDLAALMEASSQQDPRQALDYLKAAGDVEEVGEERIRGVETTRYEGVIDMRQVADRMTDEGNEAAADAVRKTVELTGQNRIPFEIWVDDDSLVRRMRLDQKVAQADSARITMELFDFGVDVAVQVPPRNQVTTLDEMLAAVRGSE
jgi:hypothetical protein